MDFSQGNIRESVITGMTGFARLEISRNALTVPRAAVLSISAGSALVHVIDKDDDNKWEARKVKVGHVSDSFAEIIEGLTLEEEVMIDGHWTLKPDDKIEIQRDK